MNGYLQIESRVRYNFWNLLGDVGGFNDGLFLLCQLFVLPISAMAFANDYTKSRFIDPSSNQGTREFQDSDQFKNIVKRIKNV